MVAKYKSGATSSSACFHIYDFVLKALSVHIREVQCGPMVYFNRHLIRNLLWHACHCLAAPVCLHSDWHQRKSPYSASASFGNCSCLMFKLSSEFKLSFRLTLLSEWSLSICPVKAILQSNFFWQKVHIPNFNSSCFVLICCSLSLLSYTYSYRPHNEPSWNLFKWAQHQ